jgi:hypothetical protein
MKARTVIALEFMPGRENPAEWHRSNEEEIERQTEQRSRQSDSRSNSRIDKRHDYGNQE